MGMYALDVEPEHSVFSDIRGQMPDIKELNLVAAPHECTHIFTVNKIWRFKDRRFAVIILMTNRRSVRRNSFIFMIKG